MWIELACVGSTGSWPGYNSPLDGRHSDGVGLYVTGGAVCDVQLRHPFTGLLYDRSDQPVPMYLFSLLSESCCARTVNA